MERKRQEKEAESETFYAVMDVEMRRAIYSNGLYFLVDIAINGEKSSPGILGDEAITIEQ